MWLGAVALLLMVAKSSSYLMLLNALNADVRFLFEGTTV